MVGDPSANVHRRKGGLERKVHPKGNRDFVHRRKGGLENQLDSFARKCGVHRRKGGLEKKE